MVPNAMDLNIRAPNARDPNIRAPNARAPNAGVENVKPENVCVEMCLWLSGKALDLRLKRCRFKSLLCHLNIHNVYAMSGQKWTQI